MVAGRTFATGRGRSRAKFTSRILEGLAVFGGFMERWMVSLFCLVTWLGRDDPPVRPRAGRAWLAADGSACWFPCRAQAAPRSAYPSRTPGRAKNHFPFRGGRRTDPPGRERPRPFATVRGCSSPRSPLFSIVRTFASVRVWSRLFATVRTSLM